MQKANSLLEAEQPVLFRAAVVLLCEAWEEPSRASGTLQPQGKKLPSYWGHDQVFKCCPHLLRELL